ncbi:hypothetical protein ACJIZ3_021696 [Penstemon smallii]|uniref:Uncharacterized protein n=1 Tax=Penstemon smallii TaxID=265156 RepID=A0ABD3SMZ8_9LAMI
MEGKGNISDYRSKLNKTLTSSDLTNDEIVRSLVKNQISQSSHCESEECNENVVERRSKEVSNFLSMLRSASLNDVEKSEPNEESHGGWKIKQDTEDIRVMYREGPDDTPFHTLLVEGYVDGPLDVCLCISYESDLFKKWWPQVTVPTFKVISSQCLQRVSTNEQISLVRMKASWPMACREILLHYFAFEYFQDGLVVVLLNSISDSETIDRSTHGFTRDRIPNAQDVVRIDVVGGFAFQKVTADRSYFRTIANMDIKLDFVPPTLINFTSRQLIGSGFKLYKKEVASVSKGDEKFVEALKDPLYARIREALYSENIYTESPNRVSIVLEETTLDAFKDIDSTNINHREGETHNEIEELEEKVTKISCNINITNEIAEEFEIEVKKKNVVISPKVEEALGTLEKVISILRGCNSNIKPEKEHSDIKIGSSLNIEKETNQNNIEARSPDEDLSSQLRSSMNQRTATTILEKMTEVYPSSPDVNIIGENIMTKRKHTRSRFCCLHFISKH